MGGYLSRNTKDTGKLKARRFLVRRIFKIWPAFYFLLLVQVIVRRHPIHTFLFQNLFHLQNYLGTSIAQTWTLAVEEHFYTFLALSFGLLTARRSGFAGLMWYCCVASVIATVLRSISAVHGDFHATLMWTQNRLDSLMFGVILALIYHMRPNLYRALSRRPIILILIIVAGLMGISALSTHPVLFESLGYTLFYLVSGAFLVLVSEHSQGVRDWKLYRFVSWIGVYSYALYLWHSAVREPVEHAVERMPEFLWYPLGLSLQIAGAVVLAVLATRIVEWPFLRWRERIPYLRDDKPLLASRGQLDMKGTATECM